MLPHRCFRDRHEIEVSAQKVARCLGTRPEPESLGVESGPHEVE
jgi:hypothetical protein